MPGHTHVRLVALHVPQPSWRSKTIFVSFLSFCCCFAAILSFEGGAASGKHADSYWAVVASPNTDRCSLRLPWTLALFVFLFLLFLQFSCDIIFMFLRAYHGDVFQLSTCTTNAFFFAGVASSKTQTLARCDFSHHFRSALPTFFYRLRVPFVCIFFLLLAPNKLWKLFCYTTPPSRNVSHVIFFRWCSLFCFGFFNFVYLMRPTM